MLVGLLVHHSFGWERTGCNGRRVERCTLGVWGFGMLVLGVARRHRLLGRMVVAVGALGVLLGQVLVVGLTLVRKGSGLVVPRKVGMVN